MAEIHRYSGIIFWQIKTQSKFINLRIKVYSKIRYYFLDNLIYTIVMYACFTNMYAYGQTAVKASNE